jgi:hypothetical protein
MSAGGIGPMKRHYYGHGGWRGVSVLRPRGCRAEDMTAGESCGEAVRERLLGLQRLCSIAAPFWRCHMTYTSILMTSRRHAACISHRQYLVRRGGVE